MKEPKERKGCIVTYRCRKCKFMTSYFSEAEKHVKKHRWKK